MQLSVARWEGDWPFDSSTALRITSSPQRTWHTQVNAASERQYCLEGCKMSAARFNPSAHMLTYLTAGGRHDEVEMRHPLKMFRTGFFAIHPCFHVFGYRDSRIPCSEHSSSSEQLLSVSGPPSALLAALVCLWLLLGASFCNGEPFQPICFDGAILAFRDHFEILSKLNSHTRTESTTCVQERQSSACRSLSPVCSPRWCVGLPYRRSLRTVYAMFAAVGLAA